MGRDNNNAGIHFKRWYRGDYTDLKAYDRLAQKSRQENPERTFGQIDLRQEYSRLTDENQNLKNELHELKQKIKKLQNKKEQSQNINQSSNQSSNKVAKGKYGTENLIDTRYMINDELIMHNIMRIAIQKKLDIHLILIELEDLMRRDKRMNEDPSKFNSVAYLPHLFRMMTACSLLAERLGCDVWELFDYDEDKHKQFVSQLIEEVKNSYWEDCCEDDNYLAFEIDSIDRVLGMIDHMSLHLSDRMNLAIEKMTYDNGEFNYSLSFGCLTIHPGTTNYFLKGCYLLEEDFEGGILSELMDYLLEHNKAM